MATKTRDASPLPTVKSAQDTLLGHLARRVRILRAQRGMTRKQLAEQSGVSVPYLARVEGGEGNVSVALLHKLSVALNVPMQDFLSDAAAQNADLTMLVQFLKQQSPATLARLRQQLISTPGFSGMGHGDRIALIGLRGAGKSTLGALLAAQLDAPFVELHRSAQPGDTGGERGAEAARPLSGVGSLTKARTRGALPAGGIASKWNCIFAAPLAKTGYEARPRCVQLGAK